ncbi:hypothetical protein FRC06_004094 [Ceratobasidium sp. 370]|nr:hypothetical protein FRC06_004094 [Ceratobasidium sp. 370]
MEFGPEWGEGEIFDWCRRNFRSRIINRLEIRITRGAVPHRFVVAYMEDGFIWRFDRRPRSPLHAADEVRSVTKAELIELELSTRWEVRLDLPAAADIFMIIAACYAIDQDKKARNHTLLEYNCYFFAWAVLMVVVRYLLISTAPSPRQSLYGAIRFKEKPKLRSRDELVELTLEDFQLNITKFIQSVPGQTPENRTNMEEAMLNAWDMSRKTFRPLGNLAP